MSPCVGVPGVCPPLARMSEFKDGSINIRDCLEMHLAIGEIKAAHNKAVQAANNARGR